MSGGDEVYDDGQTQKCHPALIYDNVEKDYRNYKPDHCSFVAVFWLGRLISETTCPSTEGHGYGVNNRRE